MFFMCKNICLKFLLILFLGHVLIAGGAYAESGSMADTNRDKVKMDDVKKELSEAMDAMRAYSGERQADAMKEMEAVLEKMDARIAALSEDIQKKWEALEPEAREKARETLERLRRLRDRLATSMEEWKSGGKSTWNKIKSDFLNAWEEFQKSLEDKDSEKERPVTYL
jgi:hypothetical protein